MGRNREKCTPFAPNTSEVAVGFLVFLYLVHNLPQLQVHSYF